MLLVGFALAGIPHGLRPVAAPADVAEKARASGFTPVCSPIVSDQVNVCFRVWEERRRRWVRPKDLAQWEVEATELLPAIRTASAERLPSLLEKHVVTGQAPGPGSTYWMVRDGDGWAAGALLNVDQLQAAAGKGRIRIAIPSAGVAMLWADPTRSGATPQQGAELDHILSVAVRELYERADDAVSPTVFSWNGKTLEPFATARAKKPEGAPADD